MKSTAHIMRCCFQVCRAEPKYTTIAFLALLGCIEVGEIEIANFTGCTGMVIIAGIVFLRTRTNIRPARVLITNRTIARRSSKRRNCKDKQKSCHHQGTKQFTY